jgi:hypothetical protein
MAALDPDINVLLEALSSAGLTDLARSAASRATAIDLPEEGDGTVREDRPTDRLEQLDLANKAVVSRLEREMSATDRLRGLMPQFGLDSILVTPATVEREGRADDLMAQERRDALAQLQNVWTEGVRELRRDWEAQDGK